MAVWPTELPGFVPDNYREAPISTVLESTVDGGEPKTRQRFTADYDNIRVTAVYTPEELAIFKKFFRESRPNALPFEMPHPRTGDNGRWIITGNPPYTITLVNTGAAYLQVALNIRSKP